MGKYPLYVALPELASSESGQSRLTKIRDRIMQSGGSTKFHGWNKHNFLRAISSKSDNQPGYILGELSSDEIIGSLRLDSGELIDLVDLFDAAAKAGDGNSFWFVFLYGSNLKASTSETELQKALKGKNIVAWIIENDIDAFAFGLACEAVHFWNLKSSKEHEVTARHLFECLCELFDEFKQVSDSFSSTQVFCDPPDFDRVLWQGGKIYANEVDFDKFRVGARIEQRLDSIKRMLDAAAVPRYQHTLTSERMKSTQALFWLAEVNKEVDVKGWIRDTQLLKEIDPSRVFLRPMEYSLPRRKNIKLSSAEILSWFVTINAGRFPVGVVSSNVDSEPPADHIEVDLKGFRISKTPVTNFQWSTVVNHPISDDHPLVDRNWFQCLAFCKILQDILRGEGLANIVVRLPTEYQWEAAARGVEARRYPWGEKYNMRGCNAEMRIGRTTEVGQFSTIGDSWSGCSDMAGNVREWTSSYGGTRNIDWQPLKQNKANQETANIIESSRMIVRGGSYSYDQECVQSWVRNTQIASRNDKQTGFRIVIVGAEDG